MTHASANLDAARAERIEPLQAAELAAIRAVEAVAATLIVVEIFVLFAGVVARYVLHSSIPWSDELATALFLWLVMLGSVIAMHRGEHMRLTFVAEHVGPAWRSRLEIVSIILTACFFAALVPAAIEHTREQWPIISPGLQVRDSLRVAAVPVGAVLMLLVCLSQIARRSSVRAAGLALLGVGCLGLVLWLLQPALLAIGNYNLAVFFVVLLSACVATGLPIAVAFGVSTLAYLGLVADIPFLIVVGRMEEGISSLVLLSVPLFIFLGVLIEMTGLAAALIGFLVALLGHVRGGLSYVLVGGMYLVSGISGAKAADMAAIAPVLAPEMKRRGVKEGQIAALLASSGAMSETIPPSLVLITIGSVTGVSIGALFAAGIIPALLLAACLAAVIFWKSRGDSLEGVARPSLPAIGRALLVSLPALALPFTIRAAVVEGIATATEVSTIGIVYSVLVGLLVYRRFDWRRLYPMLVDTAALTGAILLIVGAATAMAWALTQSGFSQQLADAIARMPGGAAGFLAVSIVAFAVLGSLLEGIPAIVLFGPLLFPAARALGIDEVHYAIVVIVAMGLGLFAPPFGVGYYIACAIGREDSARSMRAVWVYLTALLVGLIVIAAFPIITIGVL